MTFQQQFEHAKVSLIRTQKPKAEGEKVSLVDGLRANQATDSSASAVPPHPGSVQDAVAEEVFPATSAIFDLDISGLRHSDSVRGSSLDESFSNLAPREDHHSALPTKKKEAGPLSLRNTRSSPFTDRKRSAQFLQVSQSSRGGPKKQLHPNGGRNIIPEAKIGGFSLKPVKWVWRPKKTAASTSTPLKDGAKSPDKILQTTSIGRVEKG